MNPSMSACQALALARQASTGEAWCLLRLSASSPILILREADVVSGGPHLIDAILWSTETAASDRLDPALLA